MTTLKETTTETTETTEIEETEEEALILEEENKGLSYSTLLVCCHNTINALNPFLTPPSPTFGDYGLYPHLSISSKYLANPYVTPHFDSGNPQHLTSQNVSPAINVGVTKNP